MRGPCARSGPSRAALALVLILGGAAAVTGGCGKRGGGGSDEGGGAGGRTVDLSTPEAVLLGVAHALARGDLDALDARLTPDARAAVRRDLEAFRTALSDPSIGPRYAARLPQPRDDAEVEIFRKALLEGDPAGLLHVLLRASPRPAPPPQESPPAAPVAPAPGAPASPGLPAAGGTATHLERDLPAGDGTRRRVVLVRQGSAWYVDRLQL